MEAFLEKKINETRKKKKNWNGIGRKNRIVTKKIKAQMNLMDVQWKLWYLLQILMLLSQKITRELEMNLEIKVFGEKVSDSGVITKETRENYFG